MKTLESNKPSSIQARAQKLAAGALAVFTLAAVWPAQAHADDDWQGRRREHRPPTVPAAVQVPAGQKLAFRTTGVGVQIYVWTVNPTNAALASWVFKAPHAVLFHEREGVVGIHFAGPTWQGNDGSKVVAARLNGVTVDPTAVPWLLLEATSTSGEGIFTDTTYIQRLNTEGGLAPSTPGNTPGEEALVPYAADYYFYQALP